MGNRRKASPRKRLKPTAGRRKAAYSVPLAGARTISVQLGADDVRMLRLVVGRTGLTRSWALRGLIRLGIEQLSTADVEGSMRKLIALGRSRAEAVVSAEESCLADSRQLQLL